MRPIVIWNIEMSADGKIGKKDKEILLSNKLNQSRIEKMRSEVDALIFDFRNAEKFAENRKVPEKGPKIVIIDPKAELPKNSKILNFNPLLIVAEEANAEKVKNLRKNFEVMVIGKYAVNLHELLAKLYRRGIRKCIVEDKEHLANRMLNENLIDEIFILVNPLLIGNGKSFIEKVSKEINFSLKGIVQYGDAVLLHYIVAKEQEQK
ncbi:MAG: dihydrofolate reductase family protein [Candidatus Altiarchaeota archaeon]